LDPQVVRRELERTELGQEQAAEELLGGGLGGGRRDGVADRLAPPGVTRAGQHERRAVDARGKALEGGELEGRERAVPGPIRGDDDRRERRRPVGVEPWSAVLRAFRTI
jgi:hypothetical protein